LYIEVIKERSASPKILAKSKGIDLATSISIDTISTPTPPVPKGTSAVVMLIFINVSMNGYPVTIYNWLLSCHE
jgi:hypothetical protein